MDTADSTCWTMIRGAAEGRETDREAFARRYEPVVRAYLAARWRDSALRSELDDTVQDVFLDCFRQDGPLGRADSRRSFRAFLFGVVRNIALRAESARKRAGRPLDSGIEPPAREEALSEAFDRAWARSIVRQAADLQAERATSDGEGSRRRVEILRLRFQDDLPIREIAKRWSADPAQIHHEYAKARQEFARALKDIVAGHQAGTPGEIERECARLVAFFQ